MERRTTHDDEGNEKGMEGEGERVSSRRGWVRSPRRGCPFAMRQRVHCTRFYVKNVYLREESFERNIDSPETRCVAVVMSAENFASREILLYPRAKERKRAI